MTFRAAVVNPQAPTVSIRGNVAQLLTLEVDGCRFIGLEFRASGTTARQLVRIGHTVGVIGGTFEDCTFHGADTETGSNYGGICGVKISGLFSNVGLVIRRCVFRDLGGTPLGIGVLGAPYGKIEDNLFAIDTDAGTGIRMLDTAAVATGKGLIVRNNDFTGFNTTGDEVGITMTAGTEDQFAGIMIRNNFFALLGAAAITANVQTRALVNNYRGDTGTGGTLVDAGD